MKRKNILLTLMFACCPGFGQMYQGYMKRGVSLTFWFIAIIASAVLLNMGAVAVLAIVVWAYAFFDTFNIRNLSEQQRAYFYDDYIPNQRWIKEHNFDRFLKPGNSSRIAGFVFIAIGVVVLWNSFVYSLAWSVYEYFPGLYNFVRRLPTLAVAIGVICLGVWMIRRSGGHTGGHSDDVIPFGKGQNSQNPADYMPKSNTPPAPWAQASTPAGTTPDAAEPELVVDDNIVLETVTGDDILSTDASGAKEEAPAAEETADTAPENEDEDNA